MATGIRRIYDQLKAPTRIYGNTFLVFNGDERLVLKRRRATGSLSLLRRLRETVSFLNELLVNRELSSVRLKHFMHPRLLETDGRTYALFEYVEGSRGIDRDRISDEDLVEALVEFQLVPERLSDTRSVKPVRLLKTLLGNVPLNVIRVALTQGLRHCGPKVAFKAAFAALGCSVSQRRARTQFFQHNDLGNAGNKISTSAGVCFIDFAQARVERKWVMIDIVDLTVSRQGLTVDRGLFARYLLRMQPYFGPNINS